MFSRLPIRLRLALVFVGVMGVVLLIAGLALHLTLAHDLDGAIDVGLRARAADVTSLVVESDQRPGARDPDPLTQRGERYAQVLDARGRILDATALVSRRPLVAPAALAADLRGPRFTSIWAAGVGERLRVLAVPAVAQGRRVLVVVATALTERDGALRTLSRILLIGGPITLLIVAAAGDGVARAALRPVEWMRRRAERISVEEPGARLPAVAAHDEIGRLGETLNDMLARVDEALERERRFVADASHELRTPLTILRAELELARTGRRTEAELRAAIASAEEEAERLTRLADDLLVVARADRGRLAVRPEAIPAAAVLEAVRDRFAPRSAQAGRAVVVAAAPELTLRGDRLGVEQALGNLIDNALRHGAGTVTLEAGAAPAGIELRVKDEGPGIPADFVPHAFERFSRADHARGRGGAGLGLSIVQAIARAHGGACGLRSPARGGTCAWISLPSAAAVPVERVGER